MENRLKERLTGAAILVALIVLVVPEMFHGAGAPAGAAGPAGPAVPGATAAGTVEEAPLRSYTIDLTHPGALPSPRHATPAEAPTPAAAPVPEPPAVSERPAAAAHPSAAVHPRAPAAVHDARPAAGARSALAAPAAPAAPAAQAAPATPAAIPAGWGVQLGVFANAQNAQRLTRTARAKGFSVRISRTGPKGLHRVWIAGLADRASAEQMSRKLHAAGLPGALIRPR